MRVGLILSRAKLSHRLLIINVPALGVLRPYILVFDPKMGSIECLWIRVNNPLFARKNGYIANKSGHIICIILIILVSQLGPTPSESRYFVHALHEVPPLIIRGHDT